MLSHALLVFLSQLPVPAPVAPMGPVSVTSLIDGARAGVSQEPNHDAVAIWVDERVSSAAAPRFLPANGGGWVGNSVWVAKLSGSATPGLISSALMCDGSQFTDVWSARVAHNGVTTLAVYVATNQGQSELRWVDLVAGRTCGQVAMTTASAIEGLSLVAVGASFFASWQEGPSAFGMWLPPVNGSPLPPPIRLADSINAPPALAAQVTDAGASVWVAVPSSVRGPLGFSLAARAPTIPTVPTFLPASFAPLHDVVPAEGGLFHVYNTDSGVNQQWTYAAPVGPPAAATPLLSRLNDTQYLLATQGLGVASGVRVLSALQNQDAGTLTALPGSPVALSTSPPMLSPALWVLSATPENWLQGQVATANQMATAFTTSPVAVAQGVPLQRKPSIAAQLDGGWLLAWEEVDVQSPGHPVTSRFAGLDPTGGLVMLSGPSSPSVDPLLLSSPRGPVLVEGQPTRTRSLLTRVGNQVVRGASVNVANSTSALVGQQRVVEWQNVSGTTLVRDSVTTSLTTWNFASCPVGAQTSRYLIIAGVDAQGLPGFLWFSDAPTGTSSAFVPCGAVPVDEVLSVAARDSAGSADVLLSTRVGPSRMGVACSLTGVLFAQAMTDFQTLAPGSTGGDEAGWFALGGLSGGLAWAESPPDTQTVVTTPRDSSPRVFEPWVASGPNGTRAMVWVSFNDATDAGTSVVKWMVLGANVDGGTDAGVDGGSTSPVDAGSLEVDAGVDGGTPSVDGGSDAGSLPLTPDGGSDVTIEFTACSCSSGVDGGLLFVALALFWRGRRRSNDGV